jgi:hypothetical protein
MEDTEVQSHTLALGYIPPNQFLLRDSFLLFLLLLKYLKSTLFTPIFSCRPFLNIHSIYGRVEFLLYKNFTFGFI